MSDEEILEQLAQQLSKENGVPRNEITVRTCGNPACRHVWNGPSREVYPNEFSVTCSQCGADYMSATMWRNI